MVFGKCLKRIKGGEWLAYYCCEYSYVAAKTVYFGVGGGVLPFCNLLQETKDDDGDKLVAERVFESDSTVKRELLKVSWLQ